jgi:hypothetical protein
VKRKRFSVEQIVAALKQAELGMPVGIATSAVTSMWTSQARVVRGGAPMAVGSFLPTFTLSLSVAASISRERRRLARG